MCGHVFCVLAPSSMASLEGLQTEFGVLPRFLGGSRPLRHVSGEKSRGPTFFHHAPGPCFCKIARISKRAKSVKKTIQIPRNLKNITFSQLDHSCDFGDRSGTPETLSCRVLDTLRTELPYHLHLTMYFRVVFYGLSQICNNNQVLEPK